MNTIKLIAASLGLLLTLSIHANDNQEGGSADKVNNANQMNKGIFENKDIKSLDQLLEATRQLKQKEQELNQAREAEFRANRDEQKQLVEQARNAFLRQQKRANPLVDITEKQQSTIEKLQKELNDHKADLGDIHSIYSQFSGDFMARMSDSLVQSQLPDRQSKIETLQSTTNLASFENMRELWLMVLQEMTEAGKTVKYQAEVTNSQGQSNTQEVIRLGTFTMFSNGHFLRFIPENQELLVIEEQPIEKSVMEEFVQALDSAQSNRAHASGEVQSAIIDPSRGDLLAILGQSPSLYERLLQGKEVGFAIVILGAIGLMLIIYRVVYLSIVWIRTQRQLNDLSQINTDNPLGRVFYSINQLDNSNKQDEESLQLALDEAVLKELPKLEQGHSLIKLFAAIAPLLGLLGTVIGMIATFQSISLFGSGDAKLMASGISQALVTTVLGLCVAIPLLLSHNLLVSFSKVLLQILDEQSAGILAKDRESDQYILEGREAQNA